MGHAQHGQEDQGAPVNIPYRYGGQWFDDMGALALAFADSPRVGIDIARSGVDRAQANDMAMQIGKLGITAYDQAVMPPIEEMPDADFA